MILDEMTSWAGVANVISGSVVKVRGQPGQPVVLPCTYDYEDHAHISQLSVQWKSPHNQLLCNYIKHKAFHNCTVGYAISYSPGSITLSIQQVQDQDFGDHVCSVSKRHEFSDHSIELVRLSEAVTVAPKSGGDPSGYVGMLILLHILALFVCM